MRDVWNTSFWTSSKTIDVHLGWVRRKLGDDSRRPDADHHHPRQGPPLRGRGPQQQRTDHPRASLCGVSAPAPTLAVIGGGQLARMMAQPAIALGLPLRLLAEAEGVSAAQVIPDHLVGDYRDLDTLVKVTDGCAVVTFDHEHVPDRAPARARGRRPRRPARPGGARARPGQGRDAGHGSPSSTSRARATPWSARVADVEAFGFPCVLKTTRGGYDGKGVWFVPLAEECAEPLRVAARDGVRLLAEERVDFRRELSRWSCGRPSGQAAAYPVVASTQRDGICHEVIAPAPGPGADAGRAGPGDRAADRGRPRRDRRARGRAVRDHRRPGAGQRAGDAAAQHRPLDPGRRGHLAVREPPARGDGPAARLARAPGPVDGDGQHPRRPGRRPAASTTGTRTRWPATRSCGCTSTARSCVRAARSATSTPTATTSTTAWSARGTPPRGSAATWETRVSEP